MSLNIFHMSATFLLIFTTSIVEAQSGSRPFGGGRSGDRPGFPGFEPAFMTRTCDAEFDCDLRNGEQGIFVCRETFHPITGNSQIKAKCIPSDRSFQTDMCGCCGEDCPVQPEFQPITCADQDAIVTASSFEARGGGQRGGGGLGRGRGRGKGGSRIPDNAVVVCRELYNPFTGVLAPVTIPIDPEKSLEGDVCGCCESICPEEIGSQLFERPDEIELDWCPVEQTINCTLPHRRRNGDDEDEPIDGEEEQGVFVCRSMANMLTGIAESQALCIPTDRAWETDGCGCCGQDCPERPERVDIECPDAADQCERRNGEAGVFVCRSLFHPLDRSVIDHTMCISEDKAWATDDCGCCEDGCPSTPEGGFDSEQTQLMELAVDTTSELDSLPNDDSAGVGNNGLSAAAFLAISSAVFCL